MTFRDRFPFAARLGAVAVSVVIVSSAMGAGPLPPRLEEEPTGAPVSTWAAVILMSALVIGATAMKSRRGHNA